MTTIKNFFFLLLVSLLFATSAYPQSTQPGKPNVTASQMPAFTGGDCTSSAGSVSLTCGSVSGVKSGVYASKPSASSALMYYATDLGSAGCLLISNGTLWKPAGGICVIAQSGVQSSQITASTAETNVGILTIPAGLVSANGSLQLTVLYGSSGTGGTKTAKAYFSATSGSNNGTAVINQTLAANAAESGVFMKELMNRNSQSSQITQSTGNVAYNVSSSSNLTTNINTANVSYINLTVTNASNSSDASWVDGYKLLWVEP